MKKEIPPPYDIFGRPYTKETFLWWRGLGEAEREQLLWSRRRPDPGVEGVEKLLKEFGHDPGL